MFFFFLIVRVGKIKDTNRSKLDLERIQQQKKPPPPPILPRAGPDSTVTNCIVALANQLGGVLAASMLRSTSSLGFFSATNTEINISANATVM